MTRFLRIAIVLTGCILPFFLISYYYCSREVSYSDGSSSSRTRVKRSEGTFENFDVDRQKHDGSAHYDVETTGADFQNLRGLLKVLCVDQSDPSDQLLLLLCKATHECLHDSDTAHKLLLPALQSLTSKSGRDLLAHLLGFCTIVGSSKGNVYDGLFKLIESDWNSPRLLLTPFRFQVKDTQFEPVRVKNFWDLILRTKALELSYEHSSVHSYLRQKIGATEIEQMEKSIRASTSPMNEYVMNAALLSTYKLLGTKSELKDFFLKDKVADPIAVQFLLTNLERIADPAARYEILSILDYDDQKVVQALLRMVIEATQYSQSSNSSQLRLNCFRNILASSSSSADEATLEVMNSQLDGPEFALSVLREGARKLGKSSNGAIKQQALNLIVTKYMRSGDKYMRLASLEAIEYFDFESVKPFVSQLAEGDQDSTVRWKAQRLLAKEQGIEREK